MIDRVLKDLGRIQGVNGSLVVGKDGLIIEKEHRRVCSLLLRILIYKQNEKSRVDLKQGGSGF